MDRTASGVALRIRLAREGQAEALESLLTGYRSYLRLLASTCVGPDLQCKADASDVVQETLLKAHSNFHQFRGTTEGEWIAWVRSILARNIADLHRRYGYAGRDVHREQSLDANLGRSSLALRNLVPARGPSPSGEAEVREAGVLLADALDAMEPDAREVIVLRSIQELPWAEVAERMGRQPDAVRQLWTRALKRLGAALGEDLA
jgi:RNA polymerase sigma-70 factor (ECF subfamily)